MTLLSPTRAAVAAHLTPVTAALAAFASRDPFVRAHGRAAFRFHCSVVVYLAAIVASAHLLKGSLVLVQLVPFLLFLNLMIVLNALLFAAVGIHRAATGQTFTYPMTLGRT
jgi:uncharacterized Tic20 family protein